MKKSLIFSLGVLFVLIPATLFLGTRLTGRMYYLTSSLIVIETMLPFFFSFEQRRPKARELVLLAVLCALSVASRIVIQFPNFKPMMGILMITGMVFGAEAGFLTGAVSALVSNFFFSQGPWTPWQMMAYGVGGFLGGLQFHQRRPFPGKPMLQSLCFGVFGFVSVVLLVGPLLDCSTLFTTGAKITPSFATAVFVGGLAHNLPHAAATALTLFFLSRPLTAKLERVCRKYGMTDL